MKKNRSAKDGQLTLGKYLASIRTDRRLTLREVEEKTHNEVSNAYLSQIERDLVPKPSARVLGALADAYDIDSVNLLEMVGYVDRSRRLPLARRGRVSTLAEHNLSSDEVAAVLSFLHWYRHQNRSK
jgi:transcriptional regulator with XRE-family HTH domain